jgi:hypothetical protein
LKARHDGQCALLETATTNSQAKETRKESPNPPSRYKKILKDTKDPENLQEEILWSGGRGEWHEKIHEFI